MITKTFSNQPYGRKSGYNSDQCVSKVSNILKTKSNFTLCMYIRFRGI